ncbi:hypothetical protein [Dactylosporangium sp. CA-139066]|uniref:hypothetical protein n=1 Tax=Dactylosporangium sp. CA-139066 TaxID=3239930 RepID=UPI003D8CE417
MRTYFLIVTQHAWLNESGHGVEYRCVSSEFARRETALRWASAQFDHDDLNIATVTDGRIVAFGSGMDDFGPDVDGTPHFGHDLGEIAEQIGLTETSAR